jgi:hypothetical protein
MRRYLVIYLVVAWMDVPALSADDHRLGAFGGASRTNVSDVEFGETLPQWLVTFGATLEARPRAHLGFRLEAAYLPTATLHIGRVDSRLRLDWLQVPLLLRLGTGGSLFRGHGRELYVIAGPAVAVRLHATGDDTLSYWNIYLKNLRHTDFAVVFGGGAAWTRDRMGALVEWRYSLGLVDIDPEESNLKTRASSIRGGVTVRLR